MKKAKKKYVRVHRRKYPCLQTHVSHHVTHLAYLVHQACAGDTIVNPIKTLMSLEGQIKGNIPPPTHKNNYASKSNDHFSGRKKGSWLNPPLSRWWISMFLIPPPQNPPHLSISPACHQKPQKDILGGIYLFIGGIYFSLFGRRV